MKNFITLSVIFFLFTCFAQAQVRTSMNVKDVDSKIEKYVKKNLEGYKITEAYKY